MQGLKALGFDKYSHGLLSEPHPIDVITKQSASSLWGSRAGRAAAEFSQCRAEDSWTCCLVCLVIVLPALP